MSLQRREVVTQEGFEKKVISSGLAEKVVSRGKRKRRYQERFRFERKVVLRERSFRERVVAERRFTRDGGCGGEREFLETECPSVDITDSPNTQSIRQGIQHNFSPLLARTAACPRCLYPKMRSILNWWCDQCMEQYKF